MPERISPRSAENLYANLDLILYSLVLKFHSGTAEPGPAAGQRDALNH